VFSLASNGIVEFRKINFVEENVGSELLLRSSLSMPERIIANLPKASGGEPQSERKEGNQDSRERSKNVPILVSDVSRALGFFREWTWFLRLPARLRTFETATN
jgi:hypothetical protein